MTPDHLHEAACRAGALVLGEEGTRQQYMMDLEQLARFVLIATLPPVRKENAPVD